MSDKPFEEETVSNATINNLKSKHKIRDFEEYEAVWEAIGEIQEQQWFWPSLIPLQTSTIFTGSGGLGKSLVLLFMIAHTTNGKEFSCCGHKILLPQGSVILMSAEGTIKRDVTPKLIAMEADLSKIHPIIALKGNKSGKKKLLQLDENLNLIEEKIIALSKTENPVKLFVIDPITYFAGNVKDHIPREVCDFLFELNELAEKHSIALLFNKHRRKQSAHQTFTNLADEVGGTAAWVNSPRQAIGFIKHPIETGKFLMSSIKSNITEYGIESYCYSIKPTVITVNNKTIPTIKIEWADKMEKIDLNNASSKELFARTKTELCDKIIYTHLKEYGVSTMKTINELCNAGGINERLRQRVIKKMKAEGEIEEVVNSTTPCIQLKLGFGEEHKKFKNK